jgi:hypothetical protein
MAIWSTYLIFGIVTIPFIYGIYNIFTSEANPAQASRLMGARAPQVSSSIRRPPNFALEDTINQTPKTPPPLIEDMKPIEELIIGFEEEQLNEAEPNIDTPSMKSTKTTHISIDLGGKQDTTSEDTYSTLNAETGQLSTNSDFSDFHERLAREGAQVGQVQISLIWDNINDLDLSVLCPSGERISFDNNISKCGGQLDIDMNESPTSDKPVENVFWPLDNAPKGEYKVIIEHFEQHAKEDLTDYRVLVNDGFEHREYRGEISNDDPPRVACIFPVG